MYLIDAGAVRAVSEKKSLFGAGIISVEGEFSAHDNVSLCDHLGRVSISHLQHSFSLSLSLSLSHHY
jgi:glutamate 5-kinase